MVLDKLFKDITEKKFTDVEIVLQDNCEEIRIDAHKCVLGVQSDYFQKLLTDIFGNANSDAKNTNQYRILVDDAKIAHDVVMSLYGMKINSTNFPRWQYVLKTFECRNFFLLENNVEELYDLEVPTEAFELLMSVVEKFDLTDIKLVQLVRRNIPMDYNVEKFSTEFCKELLRVSDFRLVTADPKNHNCYIWNLDNNKKIKYFNGHKKIKYFNGHKKIINNAKFSPDGKIIASGDDQYNILLWSSKNNNPNQNIQTNDCIVLKNDSFVLHLDFSPCGRFLVSGDYNGLVKLWNLAETDKSPIILYQPSLMIWYVKFSTNGKMIASGNYNGIVVLWDTNGKKLDQYCTMAQINVNCLRFLENDTVLAVGCNNGNIIFWDIDKHQILKLFHGEESWSNNVYNAISSTGKYVAHRYGNTAGVWDLQNEKILFTTKVDNITNMPCMLFSNDDNLFICSHDSSIKIFGLDPNNDNGYVSKRKITTNCCEICFDCFKPLDNELDKKLIEYLQEHDKNSN